MIDRKRYASDGLLMGLQILPPQQAQRIGHHVLRSAERSEPLLHALAGHEAVLAPVRALLGADLMVRNADVFIKLPGCRGRIDWHLDTAVPWPRCAGMINLWLALSPSGPDSGGVHYLPGHHRQRLRDGPVDGQHLTLTAAARSQLPLAMAVCPSLEPGQGTLHAFTTPHRSGANQTAAPRIGLVLRYVSAHMEPALAQCGQGFLVSGEASGGIGTRSDFPIGWHRMR